MKIIKKLSCFSGRFIVTNDIHILRNMIFDNCKQFEKI